MSSSGYIFQEDFNTCISFIDVYPFFPLPSIIFNYKITFRGWQEPCVWLTVLCLSSTAVNQFLLFSSKMSVRGIPFTILGDEDLMIPVTRSPSFFIGIDFWAEMSTIFFSDRTKDIIAKQKTDGTGEEGLFFAYVHV